MIARRFAAILLLVFATGNAAAPIRPDSPSGRQAFNRCLVQADIAWRIGQRADALRWYHSAKKVAIAHNLTLSGPDMALVGFITRHEAGLAGPQPGRAAGCETDGNSGQPSHPTTRLGSNQGVQPLASKTIPPHQPGTSSLPLTTNRTIPGNPTRVLQPSTAATASTPIDAQPPRETEDGPTPDTTPPMRQPSPTSKNATPTASEPDPAKEDDTPAEPEPSPPVWPDTKSATDPEPADSDLVPPVSPPRTSAPPAPTRPTRDENLQGPSEVDAVKFATPPISDASATTTDVDEHPVRLTVDHSAVPITPPDALQEAETSGLPVTTSDPESTSPGTPPAASRSISDHQLILMMFGPIVVALFLLGLLTQEMPGPLRLLAWIRRRKPQSNSAKQTDTKATPAAAVTDSQPALDSGGDLLTVKISIRRRDKVEFYTATIEVPGLEPARIVKRRDGSPLFQSRAAAVSSARHFARRLGFDGIAEPASRKNAA